MPQSRRYQSRVLRANTRREKPTDQSQDEGEVEST